MSFKKYLLKIILRNCKSRIFFPLIIIIIIIISIVVIYLKLNNYNNNVYNKYIVHDQIFPKNDDNYYKTIEIKSNSKCNCKTKDRLLYNKINNKHHIHIFNDYNFRSYKLDANKYNLNKVTCDIYYNLIRGPSQKIISYSLFGQNNKYYEQINSIIFMVKTYYPGWIIRIYYDDSSKLSIICNLECSNTPIPMDFCYINKLPNKFNALHMYKTFWRWLPLGDDFVDILMSRDSDAWIIKREFDSVDVWLNTNNLFHIMRDHQEHNEPILAGMWGIKTSNNRVLSNYLFSKIINKTYLMKYKSNNGDQLFLREHVWNIAVNNATIHDSFFCRYFNGTPFPTKRDQYNCFVSCRYCCRKEFMSKNPWPIIKTCPIDCRPNDHINWEFC